ncbi:MAG: hypothetical protein HY078_12005 [Elusimicrobia bacterium]|nr:hypothetical protein [Elusimicrobiota bacterium]
MNATLSLLLAALAAPAAFALDESAMASNFSGTFVRSVTSKENPASMDLSRGGISVLGRKMRFELDINGREPIFAEIYDLNKKQRLEVNLIDRTVAEKPMSGLDIVDALLNAGLPMGKFTLQKSADRDEMPCGRDTHYTVTPQLDDAGQKQWTALKAYMYICLSQKGIPSIAGVRTIERGQPWKNFMTLQNVKAGRAVEDDFRAPKGFKMVTDAAPQQNAPSVNLGDVPPRKPKKK